MTDPLLHPHDSKNLERPAFLRLQPDQDATFDELLAAADWQRDCPGQFVDPEEAAELLGVSVPYVGRLAAQGRLPWLPTGRAAPSRVYRRAQIEGMAWPV